MVSDVLGNLSLSNEAILAIVNADIQAVEQNDPAAATTDQSTVNGDGSVVLVATTTFSLDDVTKAVSDYLASAFQGLNVGIVTVTYDPTTGYAASIVDPT